MLRLLVHGHLYPCRCPAFRRTASSWPWNRRVSSAMLPLQALRQAHQHPPPQVPWVHLLKWIRSSWSRTPLLLLVSTPKIQVDGIPLQHAAVSVEPLVSLVEVAISSIVVVNLPPISPLSFRNVLSYDVFVIEYVVNLGSTLDQIFSKHTHTCSITTETILRTASSNPCAVYTVPVLSPEAIGIIPSDAIPFTNLQGSLTCQFSAELFSIPPDQAIPPPVVLLHMLNRLS